MIEVNSTNVWYSTWLESIKVLGCTTLLGDNIPLLVMENVTVHESAVVAQIIGLQILFGAAEI
jgi:hypothetical protein